MTVSADGKVLTHISWLAGKESEQTIAVYDKQFAFPLTFR